MKREKMVIFDFDGVIADSMAHTLSYLQDLHEGLTLSMYQEAMHKQGPFEGIQKYADLKIPHSDSELERYKINYTSNKVANAQMFQGMSEVLEDLHKDYLLTINTGSRSEHSSKILNRFGIEEYFETMLSRDDEKSKVIKNQTLLDTYSVAPENCVHVTDATGDVIDAFEVGIKSIGVTWGIHEPEHFADSEVKQGLLCAVDTPEELLKAIRNYLQ